MVPFFVVVGHLKSEKVIMRLLSKILGVLFGSYLFDKITHIHISHMSPNSAIFVKAD